MGTVRIYFARVRYISIALIYDLNTQPRVTQYRHAMPPIAAYARARACGCTVLVLVTLNPKVSPRISVFLARFTLTRARSTI